MWLAGACRYQGEGEEQSRAAELIPLTSEVTAEHRRGEGEVCVIDCDKTTKRSEPVVWAAEAKE